MRFAKFFDLFLEMPRVKESETVPFPDELIEWLKNFVVQDPNGVDTEFGKIDPTLSQRWVGKALEWLFSVALHTNPPTTSMNGVHLTTTGADGRNTTRTFNGIPVPTQDIHAAFGDQYEISKLKPQTHSTWKVWAKKFMEYLQGAELPRFNFAHARKNFISPDQHTWSYQQSKAKDDEIAPLIGNDEEPMSPTGPPGDTGTSDVEMKLDKDGGLTLDQNDHAFINYFKNNPDRAIQRMLHRAFVMRYSPHLISDPQAKESKYGGRPGEYFDLTMRTPGGREVTLQRVPVNAQELRKKMKQLYELHNTPWITRGIPPMSAKNWLQKGTIKINYHKKHHNQDLKNSDFSSSAGEGSRGVEAYRIAWKQYANGEIDEPPTDVDPNARIDTTKDTWDDLMQAEAKHATLQAFKSRRANMGEPAYKAMLTNDFEDAYSAALADLLNDTTANEEGYSSQRWRLSHALKAASKYIEENIDQRKPDKKRDDRAILKAAAAEKMGGAKKADDMPDESPEDELSKSSRETDSDPTREGELKGIIDKIVRDYDIDLVGTATPKDIAKQAFDRIEKEEAKQGKNLGQVVVFSILKDLIMKHAKPVQARPVDIPASAAEVLKKKKTSEPNADLDDDGSYTGYGRHASSDAKKKSSGSGMRPGETPMEYMKRRAAEKLAGKSPDKAPLPPIKGPEDIDFTKFGGHLFDVKPLGPKNPYSVGDEPKKSGTKKRAAKPKPPEAPSLF